MVDARVSNQVPHGYDAFISYRRSDERVATAVYELLVLFGQRVFLDRRCIPLGAGWNETILLAARQAQRLLVLWSRNAAASSEMRRELAMVPERCSIVPLRLDNSPLPEELSSRQALEGLDVASRILARGRELVVQGGQNQAQAMATIVEELRSEGVELTPEQRRRFLAYIGLLSRGVVAVGVGIVVWFWSRLSRAAVGPAGAAALAFGVAGVSIGLHTPRTEVQCLEASLDRAETPANTAGSRSIGGAPGGTQTEAAGTKTDLAECQAASRKANAAHERALGICDTRRSALQEQLAHDQADLAQAQSQLRECQAQPQPSPNQNRLRTFSQQLRRDSASPRSLAPARVVPEVLLVPPAEPAPPAPIR